MWRLGICVKYARLFGILVPVVIADQISKAVILKTVPLYRSITVIPGFFDITHIHNPGGAFGFLASHTSDMRTAIFLIASFFVVGLIVYFYFSTPITSPLQSTAFALLLGGAAGNLIDRVRFGKVIDFLDFYVGGNHWPAFNLADSAITVGVSIFIYTLIFSKQGTRTPK